MTILFAGAELGDFYQAGGPTTNTATTTMYSADNTRCSMFLNATDDLLWFKPSAVAELHVSFNMAVESLGIVTGVNPYVGIGTSFASLIARIAHGSASTRLLQYWNGSAWTTLHTMTVAAATLYRMTIAVKIAASGYIRFYDGTSLLAEFAGDTTGFGFTTLSQVFFSCGSSSSQHYSEIIAADEDTTSMRLATIAPTANGANTAWTGDYTAVDEVGKDGSDMIYSATADQKETFAMSNINTTALGTRVIRAVVVTAAIRKGTTGPQNTQAVARIGSTDHDLGPFVLTTNTEGKAVVSELSPATGIPWTAAEVDAAEFGLRSVA